MRLVNLTNESAEKFAESYGNLVSAEAALFAAQDGVKQATIQLAATANLESGEYVESYDAARKQVRVHTQRQPKTKPVAPKISSAAAAAARTALDV